MDYFFGVFLYFKYFNNIFFLLVSCVPSIYYPNPMSCFSNPFYYQKLIRKFMKLEEVNQLKIRLYYSCKLGTTLMFLSKIYDFVSTFKEQAEILFVLSFGVFWPCYHRFDNCMLTGPILFV